MDVDFQIFQSEAEAKKVHLAIKQQNSGYFNLLKPSGYFTYRHV